MKQGVLFTERSKRRAARRAGLITARQQRKQLKAARRQHETARIDIQEER
jgi:hypothetical protein